MFLFFCFSITDNVPDVALLRQSSSEKQATCCKKLCVKKFQSDAARMETLEET